MAEAVLASGAAAAGLRGPRRSRRGWRAALGHHRLVLAAGLFLLVIALAACAANLVAPYDPRETAIISRLKPPAFLSGGSWANLLGTDALGRDILSRLLYGARISLLVGISAVLIGGSVGILAGLLAGYCGGRVDSVVMRLADVQLAFPFILLALAVMAVVGPGLVNVIVVLSIGQWVEYARVVRGEVLSLREREFVLAARVLGQRDILILSRHLLPNVMAPVIVISSLSVGVAILSEASLSFLGAGVELDTPTLGGMIAAGRDYMRVAGWVATIPGLALLLIILCINVVGDWLRDLLDPRLRGSM
jgi:peptide/nickel transport system permease protein